jgi:hypothetical protein
MEDEEKIINHFLDLWNKTGEKPSCPSVETIESLTNTDALKSMMDYFSICYQDKIISDSERERAHNNFKKAESILKELESRVK